jgi:glycerol-3-phosphate dehydrogenase
MKRTQMIDRLRGQDRPFDLVVIGGGATGIGTALDAAARGYSVALLEQSDFGKGTSSRSTKLIHGGVRYLQQGNIPLVIEALHERGILRRNAPHLVSDLPFVVPNYAWWEAPFYGIGMKVYDLLAGKYGFGKSRHLSEAEVVAHIPTIEREGLRGGVEYHDGQFDDARLLIHLAMTAAEQGALLANYVRVTGLRRGADGLLNGVSARDVESGEAFEIGARCVVNATGAFADGVRRLDQPDARPIIQPSQGVHVVLDRSFLPGEAAIMVPRTDDGRILFVIPWHGAALVGTTDTPLEDISLEPRARAEEVAFLLSTAARYLTRDPQPADVRSVWAGIRPLARAGDGDDTAALSREHVIQVSQSGLLTVAGGKWTTYRRMAQDTVDHAATLANLESRACVTEDLRIYGYAEEGSGVYGSDAAYVRELAGQHPRPLASGRPETEGEVLWAVREEMARTVDDVLARRTRLLQLDAQAAIEAAPRVAALLAAELSRDQAWEADQIATFGRLAQGYLWS